jgi:hypothetical protein
MTTIYVYANSNGIKCLGQSEAEAKHNELIDSGYKHTATMDACMLLEYLYNRCDFRQRAENIEALGGEKL